MSPRNRLNLLWAIVVVTPLLAVALMLLAGSRSGEREGDARARQGLRTATILYGNARAEARRALAAVVRDRRLSEALAQGPSLPLEQRAEELVAADPDLEALELRRPGGGRILRAGSRTAVAEAGLAPSLPGASRAGVLVASTTTAAELAGRVRRLTGLDARLLRGGDPLATTLPATPSDAPATTGQVRIGGDEYRAVYGSADEPAGPPVRLGVLAREGEGAGLLDSLLIALAIVLLAVMAIAAASALLLLRRRLDEVVAAAGRLREGDYRARIKVRGDDRLARLAAELNALSDELATKSEQVQQGRDELEDVTRRVGDAFASGLDPDASVELAVRTAVEACSAEAGRALPVDPDMMSSTQTGRRGPEIVAALTAAERLAFRGGGAGAAAATAARRGPRARTVAHATEVAGVHALAAPLRARVAVAESTQYVGVVSIARRERPFSTSESDLFAYLASQAAVSVENAFLHERARRQAVTDELTGLENARRFHEALADEIERTRRFSGEVGLVMVDIDDFKAVNDEYGHQQGDLVLVEVARALREQCREIDHVSRYGGEELALILPQTDLAGATELADRVRRAIARTPVRLLDEDGALTVTASLGVAAVPESAADAQGLISAADGALYRAKRAGKNRVASSGAGAPGSGADGLGGEARREANV